MRNNHRKKRVNCVVNRTVIKKGRNRECRSIRKRTACVRLWSLALAVTVIAAGWSGTEGGTVLAAQNETQGRISSAGRVQYGQALIDANDLRNICSHIAEKKNAAAGILTQLGTKFRQQSGEYTYDRNPDAEQESVDAAQIGWMTVIQAAADSQKIPDGMAVLDPEAAMHIEGVEERTQHYEAATEDNISRGKAAWAEGRLILGNGADNDRAYEQGIRDGEAGDVPDNMYPIYVANEERIEIGHVHIGQEEKKDGISGCYQNSHETKKKTTKCEAELYKTEITWYPNPDEPEGGSWHGGTYTCPYHGGIYTDPGICTHEDKETVTVWKHELICGLEDAVYAVLTARGSDTDYYDRAIRLEAVLEEGGGYEQLAWQEGDELVWTDEAGNTMGVGSELMVYEPGVYQCSLNIANADIEHKTVKTTVKIAGLAVMGN